MAKILIINFQFLKLNYYQINYKYNEQDILVKVNVYLRQVKNLVLIHMLIYQIQIMNFNPIL